MHYFYNYITSTARTSKVYLEDDAYNIEVEVPGISKDEIEIHYQEEDNTLHLSLDGEMRYVPFQYRIDSDHIDAQLDLGILTVRVPLQEKKKKLIKIK